MPIKFLLLGGGGGFCVFFLKGGGWKWQFYCYGRGDFSERSRPDKTSLNPSLHQLQLAMSCFEEVGARPARAPHSPLLMHVLFHFRPALSASFSSLVGVLRGNTIRGNTTRNSERKMAL